MFCSYSKLKKLKPLLNGHLAAIKSLALPSPESFSLGPLSARSLGKSGEYLSVTSQLTVESRIDRAENA